VGRRGKTAMKEELDITKEIIVVLLITIAIYCLLLIIKNL